MVGKVKFEARIKELVENPPTSPCRSNHCSLSGGRYANRSSSCIAVLLAIASGMMRCAAAPNDTPGVGPVVALTYRATVDVPARFRRSTNTAPDCDERHDRGGWVVGYGTEYALAGNWSVKAEPLYVQFDKFRAFDTIDTGISFSPADCANRDVKVHELIWRVGMKLPVRCLGRAQWSRNTKPKPKPATQGADKPAFFAEAFEISSLRKRPANSEAPWPKAWPRAFQEG